ncbi:MAG: hypothetical protein VXZ53_23920, partial [Planctomycetota bacterium]|nr:hypothetical protein [Planctomycetota bacterium]
VGTRSGIIQCVRAMDLESPEMHIALDLKPNIPRTDPSEEVKPLPAGPKPTEPSDPFGGKPDDDPFGTKPDDDPFGT